MVMLAIPITHVLFMCTKYGKHVQWMIFACKHNSLILYVYKCFFILGQARMMCNFFSQPYWSLDDDNVILVIS